eukprot:GGOE01009552.1.p1 GENE.GGOE01009552.1~~GGOE01009552.1.p1  ORF type:complete len:683 (+),score=219.39 GGOE01009552.1:35-2050(+)
MAIHPCGPASPPPLRSPSAPSGLRLDGFLLLAQRVSSMPLAALVVRDGPDRWLVASEGLNCPEALLESSVLQLLVASQIPLCSSVQEDEVLLNDLLVAANPDVSFLVARPLLLPNTQHCVGVLLVMDTAVPTPPPPRNMFLGLDTIGAQAMEQYSLFLESQQLQAFLPLLCHELNTPLNGLLGFHALEGSNQSVDLVESAEAVLRTVQRLQDYVEITQGKVQFAAEEFPLLECVESAVAVQARAAHGVAVRCEVPADLHVVADHARLQQILGLLVENAVKFTPAGGQVNVRAAVSEVEGPGPSEVLFEVQDTGVGIMAAHKGRLFKAFGVGDPSPTRQFGGMGLGLVIARALCEGMKGQMWFESSTSSGTRFFFTVPAEVMRRAAAKHTEPRTSSLQFFYSTWDVESPLSCNSIDATCNTPPLILGLRSNPSTSDRASLPSVSSSDDELPDFPPLLGTHPHQPTPEMASSLSILVVDDVPLNVKVMVGFLQRLGCTVGTAANGVEALAAFKTQSYDVVFTDVEMPLMDGLTLAQTLRTQNNRHLYIVGVSANTVDENRCACLAVGMNEFLSKPVRFQAVKQVVDGVKVDRETKSQRRPATSAIYGTALKDAAHSLSPEPLSPTPPKPKASLVSALLHSRSSGRRADLAFRPTPPTTTAGPYTFLRVRQRVP